MTWKEPNKFSITKYDSGRETEVTNLLDERDAWEKYRSEILEGLKPGGDKRMVVLKNGTHIISTFTNGF